MTYEEYYKKEKELRDKRNSLGREYHDDRQYLQEKQDSLNKKIQVLDDKKHRLETRLKKNQLMIDEELKKIFEEFMISKHGDPRGKR